VTVIDGAMAKYQHEGRKRGRKESRLPLSRATPRRSRRKGKREKKVDLATIFSHRREKKGGERGGQKSREAVRHALCT